MEGERTMIIDTTPTELAILEGVQTTVGSHPAAVPAARAMSHFGEHALGWMGIAAVGALADPDRRKQWIGVGVGAFTAHAASVVIKRVVKRRRPSDPRIAVNVSTPSRLSFPSSHATSTTAATILIGRVTGLPVAPLVVPPMMLSRLVLGVHYPTDVLAGAALGATAAGAVIACEKRAQGRIGVQR
jgi:membrane-associated phospholipid phosphatase